MDYRLCNCQLNAKEYISIIFNLQIKGIHLKNPLQNVVCKTMAIPY